MDARFVRIHGFEHIIVATTGTAGHGRAGRERERGCEMEDVCAQLQGVHGMRDVPLEGCLWRLTDVCGAGARKAGQVVGAGFAGGSAECKADQNGGV